MDKYTRARNIKASGFLNRVIYPMSAHPSASVAAETGSQRASRAKEQQISAASPAKAGAGAKRPAPSPRVAAAAKVSAAGAPPATTFIIALALAISMGSAQPQAIQAHQPCTRSQHSHQRAFTERTGAHVGTHTGQHRESAEGRHGGNGGRSPRSSSTAHSHVTATPMRPLGRALEAWGHALESPNSTAAHTCISGCMCVRQCWHRERQTRCRPPQVGLQLAHQLHPQQHHTGTWAHTTHGACDPPLPQSGRAHEAMDHDEGLQAAMQAGAQAAAAAYLAGSLPADAAPPAAPPAAAPLRARRHPGA